MKKILILLLVLLYTYPVYSQSTKVHGITIDGIWPYAEILDAIQSMKYKMTTRIVFDENQPPSLYIDFVNQLTTKSFIMGEILDSYFMKDITVEQYSARVQDYVNAMGNKVYIYEIGNEINGEWLGTTSDVVAKMTNAYNIVHNAGLKTALTLYYNKNCWANSNNEMFKWTNANVPAYMKTGLDYVWISYYEDDCNNYQPNWQQVFDSLHVIFPNSKIGLGECGTNDPAKKVSYMNRYYTMNITTPNYVGGYFWWYYRQDCTPKTKALWTTLNNLLSDTVPPPPPPSACNDLQEPNNLSENAYTIFRNSTYNAGLNILTDVDWFKFNTTKNNTNINFSFSNLSHNAVIELYKNTTLLKSINGSGSQNLVYNTNVVGNYFLKIIPASEPLTGCYSFIYTTAKRPIVLDDKEVTEPGVYALQQNFPNPFNPTTVISYNIPEAGNVKLTVYDITGREVMTLANEFMQAGKYTAEFNASDLASGIYIYKIEAGSFTDVKKMLLVK
ncbi:MAG: T9SS C-terminal target domain-containing protein [Ignavibacteriae bacterium]|nr:MAG: T9SS C-terminal target domain-containing protein [Ignavibacteriota bacterium]